jgi:hemerythrin
VARSWNPKWKIGIAALDAQHEGLFDRFDAFVEAASSQDRAAAATEALFFLSRYVDEHFGDEERAMADAGYPGLPVHRELHQGFVRELAGLSTRFREGGPTPSFLMALGNLFESWLTLHITREDRAFGEALRRQA